MAIWAFDRAILIGRLAFLNLPFHTTTATYNPHSDVVRGDFFARKFLNPQPGTYYYIYVLNGLKFWESHPFSLSSWTQDCPDKNTVESEEARARSGPILSFIIRPHDSFTGRFRDSIVSQQTSEDGTYIKSTKLCVAIAKDHTGLVTT